MVRCGLGREHRVPEPEPPVQPTAIDHSTENVRSRILTRMYFMYVDDGGDPGLSPNSPTRHFVLSGLVLHELRWRQFAEGVLKFRQRMRQTYGLPVRTEIHAAEYISRGSMTIVPRYNRLAILRHFTDHLATQNYLSVTNIVVNKTDKPAEYDVFTSAWRALFQRFENTLNHRNFPGPKNPEDKGIVFVDNTDGGRLTRLVRKMAAYNPIPSQHSTGYRNMPIVSVLRIPASGIPGRVTSFRPLIFAPIGHISCSRRTHTYVRKPVGGIFTGLTPF